MDFIDYRKKLGISFSDNDKAKLFVKRIEVIMKSGEGYSFNENDEIEFAYMIGESYLLAEVDMIEIALGNDPIGLQRAWLYLSKRTGSFEDFLSCVVALINTYSSKKTEKRAILVDVKKALSDSHIDFDILEDDDGIFIFPKGAKELDDALVSEPLEWLKDYTLSHAAFIKALKEYSNVTENNASDVADLFRKALETFFQEFFNSTKTLENLKSEYGTYMKSKGVPTEISNNLETLQQSYTNFINGYAKHHDKTSINVLEYLLYQTGNIIRLLITLKGV